MLLTPLHQRRSHTRTERISEEARLISAACDGDVKTQKLRRGQFHEEAFESTWMRLNAMVGRWWFATHDGYAAGWTAGHGLQERVVSLAPVVPASVKCIHDDWQIGIWHPEIMVVGMGVHMGVLWMMKTRQERLTGL
jgi:hypothetical protein